MDDVIVVGAGLGGLVLGALLAKRGRKVTVLEQHAIPGGCATVFRRQGFRFEVGLHAMDGLDEADAKMPLFRELGILEKIPFIHIPRSEFYRFRHAAVDVTIPGTVEGAVRLLGDMFPGEKAHLVEFFKTITSIRHSLNRLFLLEGWKRYGTLLTVPFLHPQLLQYWNTTIGDFLDAMFHDDMLKLILVANLLYYHDDPRQLSLFWYCLSQGSFFAGGVHFIRGGSQVLSNYLAHYIRAHGGEVWLNQSVDEILVERGCAVGVRYTKTRGRSRPEATRQARLVVANAALPVVVNELIKAPELAPYRDKVNRLQKSCSFLSLYLGLKVPPRAFGNRAYSTIIPGEGVSHIGDLVGEFRSRDWTRKGFEFVDYSQVDHGLAPSGKSVGVISLVDYIWNWEDLPAAQYQAQKEDVARLLIDKLDTLIPGVKESVEVYEVGTPKTIVRYTRNPEGCIYGFHQNVRQSTVFRLGHTSPISNLYFASAWVTPGGGFTGAMLSGMHCAREVERALGGSR